MPVSWLPKRRVLEEEIAEEIAKEAALREQRLQAPPEPIVERTVEREAPPPPEPILFEEPERIQEFEPARQWLPSARLAPSDVTAPQAPPPAVEPIESPTAGWEKPKEWAEGVMGTVGEGMSEVPILPDVLKFVAPVFEWIHEKLEKPFAAIVTSLWSPSLPYKAGESWLEHEKREYDAWKAPTYVKGIAEFVMPLWWLPWFGWAKLGARSLIGAGKTAKMASILPKLPEQALLPTYDQLAAFIPNNLTKRAALRMENVPVFGKMMQAIGGRGVFTRQNPITVAQKSKNYAYFLGIQRDMGENIVRIQMNDLPLKRIVSQGSKQVFKTEDDLFKLLDIEKVAGQNLNAKVGVVKLKPQYTKELKGSTFIDDVWQNPNAYTWTDKAAFEYVKQAHETVGWFMQWAEANGVKIASPKKGLKIVGDMIQEHIPRMAKGATSPEGLFAPFKRTNPFMEMVHDLMVEGVESGVKYGGTLAERVELMTRAIARSVASKHFDDAVKPLGKTLLERLEMVAPEAVAKLSSQADKVAVLGRALLAMQKNKLVNPTTLSTLEEYFPRLARSISGATRVTPQDIAGQITKMSKTSQLILGKNLRPLVEELLALPRRTTFYDTIRTVKKFTKNEQIAIRLAERIYKQNIKASIKEYRIVVDDVVKTLNTQKELLKPVGREVARLKRNLRIPKEELFEAKFRAHPAFNKRIFPAEVIRVLEPFLTERGNAWVRNMAQVSGLSRMMVATLDLSAPWIQGLMVFGRNPVAWARSTLKMYSIAHQPHKLYLELAKRKASRLERVLHGGSTATIDYFEAMPLLRRIAGQRGAPIVAQTYGRAEAAFLGFGEIARDELWKAGTFMLSKKGIVAGSKEFKELASTLDKMTGVVSPTALGIGLSQQQVESAWLFFSPRYTRAGLMFMGDMIRGGLTGAEARKALVGVLLGGTTMYMGITSALEQQPNLDPRSSRFMTIKIGDTHVGVGGIYYAAMRMLANVTTTMAEEPGQLSPLNFSRVDNPFYKFIYGRTAPLTGLTFGLAIEQKNYFGEPFESPADYAAFMADKVLPIALQTVMPWERKPWQDGAFSPERFAAEFGGLRAFPESAWEARDMYRDNLAREIKGKAWQELTRVEQREIEADNPILDRFDDEIIKFNIQRGKPQDILFNRWQDEIDTNKDERDDRINLAASAAEQDGDYYRFRLRVQDIESDYGAVLDHIGKNKEYASVMEALEEPKTIEQLSEMQYLDAAYNVWSTYRYSQKETPWGRMYNEFGEPEWTNVEKFRDWFRDKFGVEALNYAERERTLAGRDLPKAYLELRKAREVLREYWQVRDELIKIRGEPQTEWQARRLQTLVNRIHKRMKRTNPMVAYYIQLFYTRPKL
ncbi:hypothetical protein CMI37_31880 [Candidatus Pacearchaeota archaeon]|nr:hypothetical protein [Candidatus Pacearchaeota archaeon]